MSDDEHRELPLVVSFKVGASVRAYDIRIPYEDLERLKRPLVLGEMVLTTGVFGEIRIGKVVHISEDGRQARADDGVCLLMLDFDKDDDHEWTMTLMVLKEALPAWEKP